MDVKSENLQSFSPPRSEAIDSKHPILLTLCVLVFVVYLGFRFLEARYDYAIYYAAGIEMMTSSGPVIYISMMMIGTLLIPFVIAFVFRVFKKLRSRKAKLWIILIWCSMSINHDIKQLDAAPMKHSRAMIQGYLSYGTKTLPKMESEDVRFDGVKLENNTLINQYTYVNNYKDELDIQKLLKLTEHNLLSLVCDGDFALHLERLKLSVRFEYIDKDQIEIGTVERDFKDCKVTESEQR